MPRDTAALIAERAEMIRRSDLARGFAGMTKGTTRRNFNRKARECTAAALLLDDWIAGRPSHDVETMSDAELLAELEA